MSTHAKSRKQRSGAKAAARRPKIPSLATIAASLGEEPASWEDRCYEISCEIVRRKLVRGRAVYGHWLGPVTPRKDRGVPFAPHGWIQLDDGTVVDPTRWVFEGVAPYLFVGKKSKMDTDWPYDEGGDQWRTAMTAYRPIPVPEGPRHRFDVSDRTKRWIEDHLGALCGTELTSNQIFHLANLPYSTLKSELGPSGLREVYGAIAALDDTSVSWIPIDNLERAKHEVGFKDPTEEK